LTIDGVALTSGDRVLVKNQMPASPNGIYTAASGGWSRVDLTNGNRTPPEVVVRVSEGTTQAHTTWALITQARAGTSGPLVGTDALVFAPLEHGPFERGINVRWFGAKGDTKVVTDAQMTAANPALTSSKANFTSADVGKTVIVKGAGRPGGSLGTLTTDLVTTISSITSPTQANLAIAAGATVTGAKAHWGTDDTTAINGLALPEARSTPTGAAVYFPPGNYMCRQLTLTSSYPLTLEGEGNASVITIAGVVDSDGADDGLASSGSAGALVIRRLMITGSSSRAISIQTPTSSTTIDACDISGCNQPPASGSISAVFLINASDVRITNCTIHDCGQIGVKDRKTSAIGNDNLNYSPKRWHIAGNYILSGGTTVQIAVYDLLDSEIINNVVDGGDPTSIWDGWADGYGIMIYRTLANQSATPANQSANNRITGNTVKNTAGCGIYVQGSSNTLVAGNLLLGCCTSMGGDSILPAAISVNGGKISVSDNIIYAGAQHGIALSIAADSCNIENNALRLVGFNGIHIEGATGHNSVCTNRIEQTSGQSARITGNAPVSSLLGSDGSVALTVDGDFQSIAFHDGDQLNEAVVRINQAFAGSGKVPAVGGGESLPGVLALQSLSGAGGSISITGPAALLAKLGFGAGVKMSLSGSGSHGIFADSSALSGWRIALNMISNPASQPSASFDGMQFGNISDSMIAENYIAGVGAAGRGIIVVSGANNAVARNHIVSNTTTGNAIEVRSPRSIVEGNVVQDNSGNGIMITAVATGCVVAHNVATGNSSDGVQINSNANLVSGNTLTGNVGNGLNVARGSNNRLFDNDVSGSGSPIADSGANTTRDGNVLKDQNAPRKGTVNLPGAGTLNSKTVPASGSNNEYISGTTKVRLTRSSPGGTLGHIYHQVAGGVITISSESGTETSTIDWEIVQ